MKKENSFTLYLKIWMIHIIVYYITFGLIFQSLGQWYREWPLDWEFIGKVAASPFGGLFVFFDGFPLYIIIPIVIFLILETFPKLTTFYSYIISVFVSYIIVKYLIYNYNDDPFNIILRSNQKEKSLEISLLYAILSALFTSGISVYILLKNIMKKKNL